jgi:uncharacterized protein (TIGR03435 family)
MMRWFVCLAICARLQGDVATFEVASIKPNRSGAANSGFRQAGPGELNATNVTLKMLIAYAYDVRDYQISGGPGWLDSERYDVLAKPEQSVEAGGREVLRSRVQALLADRFQLTLHRATKELPMFALVVGKGGSKLNATKSSRTELVSNGHHLDCQKVSMESFAKVFLQGELRRSVKDMTGITGEFDFTLDWARDEAQPGAEPASRVDGASLFTALQEQLGLRLEGSKGPVEILVIDRAERASGN